MIGLHKHSLPSLLLLALGNLLDVHRSPAIDEHGLLIAANRINPKTIDHPRWRLRRALQRMAEAGYIRRETKRGNPSGITAALTDRGRIELLRHRIMNGKEQWDGKWRLILFDIPEERRRHRDFLRRKLRWIGFVELHRSIWAIPYDVHNELNELFSLLNVRIKGDVRFLVAERIFHDDDLRKSFGLSSSRRS